jgi:hypothetical protein
MSHLRIFILPQANELQDKTIPSGIHRAAGIFSQKALKRNPPYLSSGIWAREKQQGHPAC